MNKIDTTPPGKLKRRTKQDAAFARIWKSATYYNWFLAGVSGFCTIALLFAGMYGKVAIGIGFTAFLVAAALYEPKG